MSEAKDRSRTWWTRPGLDVRGGRLFVAGRDAEAIAREHGTPLYAHDLVRVGRASPRAPFGVRSRGAGRPGPARPQGATRTRAPAVRPRAGSAGYARERGHGRVLAGRGGVGARARVARGRDQLHRHEPLRSRPRCDPRAPGRPPERRPPDADRSGGPTVARVAPSGSASTRAAAPASRGGGGTLYSGPRPTKFGIFREQLAGGARRRPPARPHDRHRPSPRRRRLPGRRARPRSRRSFVAWRRWCGCCRARDVPSSR